MKNWITLPEDWLFKLVSITLTTTLTFYLFEFYSKWNLIESLWEMNEKNYIRSFLVTQVVVSGAFYFVLSGVMRKPISKYIQRRTNDLSIDGSVSNLKDISEAKSFLIRVFSMKVTTGELDADILKDQIEIPNKEAEMKTLIGKSCKWIAVFIQLAITLIFVYHLSAWYILPILALFLLLIVLFLIAVSIVINNIELIEKVRLGIVERQPVQRIENP